MSAEEGLSADPQLEIPEAVKIPEAIPRNFPKRMQDFGTKASLELLAVLPSVQANVM